jgi:molecular chaperone DnaJ
VRDLYRQLGVSPDASAEEVHRAYRRLARRYHPDAGAGSDDARFQEVSRAYEVLRDPERRASYDRSQSMRPVVRARAPARARPRVPYFSDRVSTRDVPRFIE